MCPKTGQAAESRPMSMFHRWRVTDSSGPAVLNANVVAVQNATKVSYMGQTTAAGDYSRRLASKPNHSRWKSPGFKVSRRYKSRVCRRP
jgi:hypothetical protein